VIDRSLNYGREAIARFLAMSTPFETVLDIGAGSGADLLIARSVSNQARLFALEGYLPKVERLKGLGVDARPHRLELDVFPHSDQSMDVVIANPILEHTKEVFWIMHEISRVLRVGGHVIVDLPNLAAFHNWVLLLAGRQPSPIKTFSAHVRGFTRGDFLNFLESGFTGGYRLLGFRGSNFYPFLPSLAKPLARALPNLAWGIFFLLEKSRPYAGEFLDALSVQKFETPFYAEAE
jgi:SAM-dependent methyltransferase